MQLNFYTLERNFFCILLFLFQIKSKVSSNNNFREKERWLINLLLVFALTNIWYLIIVYAAYHYDHKNNFNKLISFDIYHKVGFIYINLNLQARIRHLFANCLIHVKTIKILCNKKFRYYSRKKNTQSSLCIIKKTKRKTIWIVLSL